MKLITDNLKRAFMTWNIFGEYLDIVLTSILVVRVFGLNLQMKYLACLVFIVVDSFQSLGYVAFHYLYQHSILRIDYRIFWAFTEVITWVTTIWIVFSILISILKHLPGILRFSIRFLNIVFAVCLSISVFTIQPEYAASGVTSSSPLIEQLRVLISVIDRALSLAELLSILCVLAFVLRFPIRVPRNLAAFCAGLTLYLFLKIGVFMLRTYSPRLFDLHPSILGILSYCLAGCLVYWLYSISSAGEEAVATLGRTWQTVPQEHLIQQLEAINAALLRSREQV